MEKRVDRKYDKGCQKERARNIDARVLDFFAHGDARFKSGEAPPDHADARRKTHLPFLGQERWSLNERGKIDVWDHGEKPDHRNAPEEEHESVLQTPRYFDAADVGDDEACCYHDSNRHIREGERHAESGKERLEVIAESQCLAAGDRNQRDDEVPAGKNTGCASDSDGSELVGTAGIWQSCAHLGIKKRRINADEKCHDGGKNDRWAHQTHDIGADGEKPHADDGTSRNSDGFAHAEATFERG